MLGHGVEQRRGAPPMRAPRASVSDTPCSREWVGDSDGRRGRHVRVAKNLAVGGVREQGEAAITVASARQVRDAGRNKQQE